MCQGQQGGMGPSFQTKPMSFGNDERIPGMPQGGNDLRRMQPGSFYRNPMVNMTPQGAQMSSGNDNFGVQSPQVLQAPPLAQYQSARQAFTPSFGNRDGMNPMAFNAGGMTDQSYTPQKSMGDPTSAQSSVGTYPGATPPPGYQAPPPGPFANWMNPMMASMIGRAGAAPPGMNAFNPGNNSWGNIDWFPGIPRG